VIAATNQPHFDKLGVPLRDRPGHTADCQRFEECFPWQCDCHVRAACKDEAGSIAFRIQGLEQGDWLGRYDPNDEEWLPPRMHMAFLRMGIVSPKESPEGGYVLTPLGLAVVEELKAKAA
jgi:hypothetical protein